MDYQSVLDFWFVESKGKWFLKSQEFDQTIRDRFSEIHKEISSGKKLEWAESPRSLLARIIVLDQFSRNMFRGTSESFQYDSQALLLAKKAIIKEFDKELSLTERAFIYLPFEHSEKLEDQEDSVKLFTTLKDGGEFAQIAIDYAIQHYKIIKRFGRFPHRNEILNRKSTPEEIEFLKEEGSSF